MSLKAFHVVFIIVCIILTAGFGWWGVDTYLQTGEISTLMMGIASLIGTIILIFYFRWFLKKLRNESYL